MNKSDPQVPASVIEIVKAVREKGDEALRLYTKNFDGFEPEQFRVPQASIKKAWSKIDRGVIPAMKTAASNIRRFHKMQMENIRGFVFKNSGYTITHRYIPVDSAGVYIPAGQSPLFSTVFMAVIPAVTAGVRRICVVSPPRSAGEINPYVLVAADMCGINELYRIGGAQAIAALAYGTKSVPRVDKITGPGNIYPTMAKKQVFGAVGIDAISGPSEITVLADDSANPDFIALDLLAQAEHVNGHSLLVTTSRVMMKKVRESLKKLGRNAKYSVTAVLAGSLQEAAEIVNYKAPEHLSVAMKKPETAIRMIRHAPAIFSGNDTPVAFGDYMAGANHILPTNATARFFSGLSVLDYLRHTHVVKCGRQAMKRFGPMAEKMASVEMLPAHAASMAARRNTKK